MQINPMFGEISQKKDKKYCFVLMPFQDEYFIIFKDHILKVAKKKFGLVCEKADDIYSNKSIMDDIWKSINRAEVIIADLTSKNANVLYEIGISHTIGKEVILLTRKISDIPFDLRHLRTIEYEYTPRGMRSFESKLKKTLEEVLKNKPRNINFKKKTIRSFQFTGDNNSILLWKERSIKKPNVEYLSYEIPLKKNTVLKGHIGSEDVFHFYLIDNSNKKLFERGRNFKSHLNSIGNLEYNFHFNSNRTEKLYLMIGTKSEINSKFDISLHLEPKQDLEYDIIWDETAHVHSNDSMNYYPIKAKKGNLLNIQFKADKISNMYLFDSANWVLYNQKSQHIKIINKKHTKSSKFTYKCIKDDLWIAVPEPPAGESMEVKAFITKTK